MKFRIIKFGNQEYQVQKKESFFSSWESVSNHHDDYPEDVYLTGSKYYENWRNNSFPDLGLARLKLNKCISIYQHGILKKTFTVIEKISG